MPRRPASRPAVAAVALWAAAVAGVATLPWFDHLLRQAGRPDLTQLNPSTVPSVLAALAAATIGAVVAGRRPRHPVGWLLLTAGLAVTGSGLADGYARYGLLARPGLPAARWVATFSPATVHLGFACVGFVLLLTPSGSLPSPRWRWWAWLTAAAPVAFVLGLAAGPGLVIAPYEQVFQPAGGPLVAALTAGGLGVTAASLAVAAWSLVVRFRHARGIERQQLRWVATAAAATMPVAAVVLAGAALDATADVVVALATGVSMTLLPLATGAAILRYRLYDLDRIISRTVAYGLLTVLLGGAYALVVLGLGQLVRGESNLLVAAATLAVAAAFQPARRRVQAAVNRRFDRRADDAAQTIAAFATRLRDEVDLDTLSGELVGVVERTMQPTQVRLWLRQR